MPAGGRNNATNRDPNKVHPLNHIVDAGHDGLAGALALLRQQNKTVGAGDDADATHAPAFEERIGFLAYASVYQAGHEASKGLPGLASMRVHSHYYIPDWDAYGKVAPGAPPQAQKLRREQDVVRS